MAAAKNREEKAGDGGEVQRRMPEGSRGSSGTSDEKKPWRVRSGGGEEREQGKWVVLVNEDGNGIGMRKRHGRTVAGTKVKEIQSWDNSDGIDAGRQSEGLMEGQWGLTSLLSEIVLQWIGSSAAVEATRVSTKSTPLIAVPKRKKNYDAKMKNTVVPRGRQSNCLISSCLKLHQFFKSNETLRAPFILLVMFNTETPTNGAPLQTGHCGRLAWHLNQVSPTQRNRKEGRRSGRRRAPWNGGWWGRSRNERMQQRKVKRKQGGRRRFLAREEIGREKRRRGRTLGRGGRSRRRRWSESRRRREVAATTKRGFDSEGKMKRKARGEGKDDD